MYKHKVGQYLVLLLLKRMCTEQCIVLPACALKAELNHYKVVRKLYFLSEGVCEPRKRYLIG